MKKTTKGQWVFWIVSLIVPLIYFAMYLPIWGGNELVLANSGTPGIILFVFQCVCLTFAALNLCVEKMRHSDSLWLTVVGIFLLVASILLTLFFGYIFALELAGVEWFPAQR